MRSGQVLLLSLALVFPSAMVVSQAVAQEVLPPDRHPHPVIQRDLVLTEMRVDVRIKGGTASTTIRQTLRNDGSLVAEGQYMLPLPAGATVSDFKLIDGDQALTGKVLDAEEARRTYQEIVRQMRDPGLLEYQDSSTFSVSVFPFQPGQSRSVEVTFNQTLSGTTDLVTYNLPLRWAGWSRCDHTNFVLSYDIESQYDLGVVSSPTFGISVHREGDRRAWGTYEASMDDFTSDFALNIGRRTGDFAASLMCFPGDGGEDGYFLLSLLAAMPADAQAVPKDVLLIFDKSGSMSGDKIEQAKGALRYVLGQLNSEDRVGLIYYSDAVNQVWPGLRKASQDNLAEARRLVDGLTADGGTDIYSALDSGANMLAGAAATNKSGTNRPQYAIFLTDGLPTVGNTNVPDIVNNAKARFLSGVKLFVFGVGYDVNTTLLDELSYNHHGSATYVTEGEDIEVKVSQFYAKMANPALINLNLEFQGLNTYDLMPKQLPDLFHNNEIFISGRYRGTPSSNVTLTVSGATDKGDKSFEARIPSNTSSANHQIPRLWAARKVSYLLDQVRLRGDDRELLDEIDRLATRFGIVTPYTSYLITEPEMYFDEGRRRDELDQLMTSSREEQSGKGAVDRSKMNQANQAADVAAAPQVAGASAGNSESEYGAYQEEPLPGYVDDQRRQGSADPTTAVNYVNNQTFVRQHLADSRLQWVDARFDTTRQDVVRITTYGDTYFNLIDEFPALADYLSQGEEVVLVVGSDLALETTNEEVANTTTEISRVKRALESGEYLQAQDDSQPRVVGLAVPSRNDPRSGTLAGVLCTLVVGIVLAMGILGAVREQKRRTGGLLA